MVSNLAVLFDRYQRKKETDNITYRNTRALPDERVWLLLVTRVFLPPLKLLSFSLPCA